ncbi:hypothetical protein FF2_003089 [Malus domestica]
MSNLSEKLLGFNSREPLHNFSVFPVKMSSKASSNPKGFDSNSSISIFWKRAESDASVPDAPARPEKFAQRYTEILDDLNKDLESHGGLPDCILLCRLREQVLRELGFQDIFKKVKDEENAKAMSLFENVVDLNEILMMLLKMKSSG